MIKPKQPLSNKNAQCLPYNLKNYQAYTEQKNMTHSKEKNKPIEIQPQMSYRKRLLND